jgi:hypothetical protein
MAVVQGDIFLRISRKAAPQGQDDFSSIGPSNFDWAALIFEINIPSIMRGSRNGPSIIKEAPCIRAFTRTKLLKQENLT